MNKSSNEIVRLNIKYFRTLKGFTQKQMADFLNVDEKHYCSLEGGKYQFTLKNIDIICNVLKMESWVLFKEKHSRSDNESF